LGVLYEADDLRTGAPLVAWLLREDSGMSGEDVREASASALRAAQVKHPGLLGVSSALHEAGRLCLSIERPSGRSLSEFLGEGKRVNLATAAEVIRQAATALDAIHARGAAHGSLRLSDLTIDARGTVRAFGYGIPRASEPRYSAPERDFGAATPACDVFSLASCAHEMLSGTPPFPGPDFAEQKRRMDFIRLSAGGAGLPRSLDEAFLRAFRPNPIERTSSCGEFAAALQGINAIEVRRRSGRQA
jgi:serine/threonine-protein kinase